MKAIRMFYTVVISTISPKPLNYKIGNIDIALFHVFVKLNKLVNNVDSVNLNICDKGYCYTCNNELHFKEMECGHIIAHSLGGNETFENLMPICKTCNTKMGIMNLEEYKILQDIILKTFQLYVQYPLLICYSLTGKSKNKTKNN